MKLDPWLWCTMMLIFHISMLKVCLMNCLVCEYMLYKYKVGEYTVIAVQVIFAALHGNS